MSKQQIEKGKKKDKASSMKCVEDVQRNSVFRRYSEAELLTLMKALAVDPCRAQFSPDKIQPLLNEILIRVRNVMDLNKTEIPPWRKRKLQQFVRDNLETPRLSVPDQQNGSKLSRGQTSHVSSVSCLLNSGNTAECFEQKILSNSRSSSSLLTFEDTLPENQVYQESFFLDVANRSLPNKDVYQIVDSDESTNGSTPISPENLTVNLNDAIDHSNSSTLDGVKRKRHQPSPRSIRLLNFIGDQIDKKVIPVGPRFQADVPEWNGPVKIDDSFENSRWLGSRVWPIETRTPKSNRKKLGQGRPNSCRCESPGSADCIRCHILEKRSALQSDLGPAFFSWKFDEMGDQVLKLWTLKEQQMFDSLVKMKPRSNRNFIKHALMRFPKKSSKEIVHYYFDYFIPQRMSLQRGLSLKEINTDNEEEEEDNDDIYGRVAQRRCEGNKAITSKSKDVKTRYLRGGC